MFLRLLYLSFLRQRRRKLLATASVTLGMTIVTAMLAVGTDVGDKIAGELRTLGANIVVYPEQGPGAYLNEADLPQIKHIFWAHNILAYSPMLEATLPSGGVPVRIVGTYFSKTVSFPYEEFVTGVRKTHRWWKVEGAWPADDSRQALAGRALAERMHVGVGDKVSFGGQTATVAGILTTGDSDEEALVMPLELAQLAVGRPGAVSRAYVSALTKPEDDFARRDPRSMTAEMLERWSCSPYANSIAYQIANAIPGARAEQVRKIAQNEGVLLSRISGLMWLLAVAALAASVMAVSAAMATAIFERRREVGLMKSMGAGRARIAALFLCEAGLLAMAGGAAGFAAGIALAQLMGHRVFGSAVNVPAVLLPVVLVVALGVTLAGSAASIWRALGLDPAVVLRGDAA